jgi:hypothetical protein
MKTLNRWMQVSLALFLALGLAVGTANAEEKKAEKKKKSEKKKTEQKAEKKEEKKKAEKKVEKVSGPHAALVTGPNVNGRPGYFFMDTAVTPEHKQLMLAAGGVFYSLGSQISIPFGASYGIVENLQVHASTSFYSVSGVSGLSNLVFGAKYHFNLKNEHLSLAAGCDGIVGPLSNSAFSSFSFVPYGVVSYTLSNGLELNGQLGIYIPGSVTIGPFTVTPPSYIQVNLGAAYPFSSDWSGMAELNVNGLGSGVTPLVGGIRTNGKVQFQAFGGLDLATTVGVIVGGGLSFVTE